MKVCELVEGEWENTPTPDDWQTRDKMRKARNSSLAKEDNMIMWRLDALTKKYPDDIMVRAHPSDYDENCQIDYADIEDPLVYTLTPNDWIVFRVEGGWFFSDDMKHKEGWDDVYENFFVRKTCPQLLLVKSIVDRHNKIAHSRSQL